jgi:serine/threonine-protein kinase
MREIKEGLRRSEKRDRFTIDSAEAVRYRDLRRSILESKPNIVHFSGHGVGSERQEGEDPALRKFVADLAKAGRGGLIVEDESGQAKLVDAEALAGLFALFADSVTCVVLNACYSQEQAEAIARHIPYVIGMGAAIGDRAAIEFAVAFYDALGSGRDYEFAFQYACNAIDIAGIPESDTPKLLKREQPLPTTAVEPINTEEFALTSTARRVFISYSSREPDASLAGEFHRQLSAAGHQAFMAGESIHLGEEWPQRIDRELQACDYLLLLLSERSATSEMVIEEVRQARELRETRGKPVLLPIRIGFPIDSPMNYDLRSYLQRIQQREWHSPNDTPTILAEILQILDAGLEPAPVEPIITRPAIDNTPDLPPLPVADPDSLREPGGAIPPDSHLYIERFPVESDCFAEVLREGSLIRIKAPRQMGKTSLMTRILNHAEAKGCKAIYLTFQRAGSQVFQDLDSLLRWFCEQIARKQKCLDTLDEYWQGSKTDACTYFLEECVLPDQETPLVLGLDEFDIVLSKSHLINDFCGLLRAWNDSSRTGDANSEQWKKLHLLIAHSTEIYADLDINQSPLYNVGMQQQLLDFNEEQIQKLALLYGLDWNQIKELKSLVGGHPYLLRKSFYHLRHKDYNLSQLLETASTMSGIYSDHLKRHLLILQKHPDLARTLYRIAIKKNPVEVDCVEAFQLNSMGLISLNNNTATLRFELYRQYFRDHLQSS